ncbi:hypothetical protein [Streptomyces sp. NPDC056796]|uniref:hypothetical protein n=1 Tax=unclassified Streptomyces TaxID=2593676 RepID=UPI0036D15EA3
MSLRPTLRTAFLATAAIGAVLLPSAAAVADGPSAVPAERTESPSAAPAPGKATEAPSPAPAEATEPPSPVPAGESATPAPVPAEDVPAGTVPRGGVAAGERPAENGSTALYGSAAGAVLLAGAGVLVLRRRSAAHVNG